MTLLLITATAGAAEVKLRHDPFRVPAPVAAGDAKDAPWKLRLRGVLVSGADSLANVEGSIVRLGGQIDGYRLVKVEEGRAVFEKGPSQVVLTLDPRPGDTR